jgi:hypothetical protein
MLLALPFLAVAGLAILLDNVDAAPGAGFVGLCLISVFNGIGIGLYVGRYDKSRDQGSVATASRRAARAGR